MTIEQTRRSIAARLNPIYDAREAQWMARIILQHVTGKADVDLLIGADKELSTFRTSQVDAIVDRLLRHEPIQYILGEAWCHGHTFKVTPATLIPRPETAELIDLIIDRAGDRTDLRVLDLGTGSGCIAISLSLALRFPVVTGVDIAPDAIDVATENAKTLKARVRFEVADMLRLVPQPHSFDIIVSNPPYITESERTDMDHNVLDYEPAQALFVPDADPLLFYHAITAFAAKALSPGGCLYFEINPRFAEPLKNDVESAGFTDVTLMLDSQRRERFLYAKLP